MERVTKVQRMSGVQLLFVCLFLIMIQTSSAFFFSSFSLKKAKQLQSANKTVDDDCVAKARSGDCRFYQCFNERHACPNSTNYAINYGFRFCSRFDLYYEQMTAKGQRWLNGTRLCTMEKMLDFYLLDALSCTDVESQMQERKAACDAENGICRGRLLVENKDVFLDVYALNRQSVVQFLRTAKKCTFTKFQEVASWFSEQLHSFGEVGQSILPIFQDVEQQMGTFKNSIKVDFDQLRSKMQQIGRAFMGQSSEETSEDVKVD